MSKKSLRVLDLKLDWLAKHAEFGVTINSVLGAGVKQPLGRTHGRHAAPRQLGFPSTVGILHDHGGQCSSFGTAHEAGLSTVPCASRPASSRLPTSTASRRTSVRGSAQAVALPRRRALPLRLRGRPGPLLLAAARPSRHSAHRVHDRGHRARGRHAEGLRAVLHHLVRAPDRDAGRNPGASA